MVARAVVFLCLCVSTNHILTLRHKDAASKRGSCSVFGGNRIAKATMCRKEQNSAELLAESKYADTHDHRTADQQTDRWADQISQFGPSQNHTAKDFDEVPDRYREGHQINR